MLKVREFCLNHFDTWLKVNIRSSCSSSASCLVINMLVSSTNIIGVSFGIITFGKSLIYNMNKSGPKIDPCGTPRLTFIQVESNFASDRWLSSWTLLIYLLDKIQLKVLISLICHIEEVYLSVMNDWLSQKLFLNQRICCPLSFCYLMLLKFHVLGWILCYQLIGYFWNHIVDCLTNY